MKSKSLVFYISFVFLLACFVNTSAIDISENGSEFIEDVKSNNEEPSNLPDFVLNKYSIAIYNYSEKQWSVSVIAVYFGEPLHYMDVPIKIWIEGLPDSTKYIYNYQDFCGNGYCMYQFSNIDYLKSNIKTVYKISAEIDPYNKIEESDENNNLYTKTVFFLPGIFEQDVNKDQLRLLLARIILKYPKLNIILDL